MKAATQGASTWPLKWSGPGDALATCLDGVRPGAPSS